MYTFHNMKMTRLSQISSVDKKESECLTFGENIFLLCALISLLASLSIYQYHFFPLNQPIGGQLPNPAASLQQRAGSGTYR